MTSFKLTISETDRKLLLPVCAVAAGLVITAGGAYAQTTPIDDLVDETDKLAGVYSAVIPVAVGSMVFSVGAMMIKRVAFA